VWGPLKGQAAGAISEKRADPLNQVWADSFPAKEGEKRGRFHIIEASLHIEEESGDFVAEVVEGLNIVLQDEGGIGGGPPRERPALKGVAKGAHRRLGREAGSYHSLKDFGERSKEYDDPEGGGCVV